MGKQLNIKDERTIELAQELAVKLGKSVTATIREALEEKAARGIVEREERKAAILKAAEDFRRKMPPEWRTMTSKEIMDSIYDEDGLPE